jgi:hypothetical protein
MVFRRIHFQPVSGCGLGGGKPADAGGDALRLRHCE